MQAVVEGQLPRVRNFLRMGVDLDETGTSGLTILHRAVLSGHGDVVEILIEAGADVNATSDAYGTPLCLASLKGMTATVILLLKYRARPGAASAMLGTALHCAILSLGDNRDAVTALLNAGSSISAQATLDTRWLQVLCSWDGDDRNPIRPAQEVEGCVFLAATPALLAIRSFQSDLLEILLPFDLDQTFLIGFLSSKGPINGKGTTSATAVPPSIRELQRFENTHYRSTSGLLPHTYLSCCARNGDHDGVRLLLARGATNGVKGDPFFKFVVDPKPPHAVRFLVSAAAGRAFGVVGD